MELYKDISGAGYTVSHSNLPIGKYWFEVAGEYGLIGSYNVLLAWNTLYRVGRRSHAIELVQGSRSCGGDTVRGAAQDASQRGW